MAGVLFFASTGARDAAAQGLPPSFPAFYYGAVVVDGKPVADGTLVKAFVNGKDCTQADNAGTVHDGDLSVYAITVAHSTQVEGCATDGATVTFRIGDRDAKQTVKWKAGPQEIGLSIGDQDPPALPTSTPGPPPDATPSDPTAAAATATRMAAFTPLPAPSALPTDDQIFPTGTPGTPGTADAATTTGTPAGTPAGTTTRTTGAGSNNDDDDGDDDDDDGSLFLPVALGVAGLLVVGAGAGIFAARRKRSGDAATPAE